MKFNRKYNLDRFGPCNSVDYDKLKKIIYILEKFPHLDDATVQSLKKQRCRYCTVGKRANSNFKKLFYNRASTKDQTDSGRYNTTCISCSQDHLLPILSQGCGSTIVAHREFNQFFYGEVCRISLFLEASLQELEAQIDFLELYIIGLDNRTLFSTRNAKKSSEEMPLLHEDHTTSPLKPKLRMRLKNKPTMSVVEDVKFVGNTNAKNIRKVTLKHKDKKIRELSMKRNLKVWFQKVKDLEKYRTLNVATLIKILKKFDKVFSEKDPTFKSIHSEHLDCLGAFLVGDESRLASFEEAVTTFYAECFCFGNVQEARGNLSIVKGESNPRHLLLIGLKVGVLAMEIMYFLSLCLLYPITLEKFAVLPSRFFFSTVGFLIFFKFLWGFNIACWDHFSINYPVLLVISEKLLPDCDQIFSEALTLAIAFLTNLILYFFSIINNSNTLGSLPSYAFVLLLLFGQLAYVAHSLLANTSYSIMWNTHFFRIILFPVIYTVQFRDIYIMDWLLSFTKVLSNFTYGCCHLLSGHIIHEQGDSAQLSSCYAPSIVYVVACLNIFPIIIRQLQCLRVIYDYSDNTSLGWRRFIHPVQSLNLCRYSSSLLVVFVGALNASKDNQSTLSYQLTIALILLSTLANSTWDALMDYDQCYAPFPGQKHPLLKNRLMYKSPYLYYFILVLNPILRLLWTFSLLPQHDGASFTGLSISDSVLIQSSPAIELFRRALWGLLRMETEHLRSATRLLRDTVVPIVSVKSFMIDSFAPIHFDVVRLQSSDVSNKTERIAAVSLHVLLLTVVITAAWTFSTIVVYR